MPESYCIPTDKNETSQQVLEKVKEEVSKLGVKINSNEYDRAHRVGLSLQPMMGRSISK